MIGLNPSCLRKPDVSCCSCGSSEFTGSLDAVSLVHSVPRSLGRLKLWFTWAPYLLDRLRRTLALHDPRFGVECGRTGVNLRSSNRYTVLALGRSALASRIGNNLIRQRSSGSSICATPTCSATCYGRTWESLGTCEAQDTVTTRRSYIVIQSFCHLFWQRVTRFG